MQKLIKLSDIHYVIVDDSELNEYEWYLDDTNMVRQSITSDEDYWSVRQNYRKITHSFGKELDGIINKPLSEVEEVINGYSLEKMAFSQYGGGETTVTLDAFKDGFKAHQGLVKDKLLIDVNNFTKIAYNFFSLHRTNDFDDTELELEFKRILNNNIQSLLPKTEWDIEIINDKIKLL